MPGLNDSDIGIGAFMKRRFMHTSANIQVTCWTLSVRPCQYMPIQAMPCGCPASMNYSATPQPVAKKVSLLQTP